MSNIIIIAAYVLISVSGLTLFKLGCQQDFSIGLSQGVLSLRMSGLSIVGLILYIVSFLMYMFLVSRNNLSYLSPVATGMTSALILVVSLLIFKEQMTALQWIGWCMAIAGVILMNIKK